MGRTVPLASIGSMYLGLYWWLACVSITPQFSTADNLALYPEIPDVIFKRIEHVLTEFRQRQLRILQTSQEDEGPQFTYHFPEESSRDYQNDRFAVPPSDPRYYQPDPAESVNEEKRLEDEASYQDPSLIKPNNDQLGTPVSSEEETSVDNVTTDDSSDPQADVPDVFKKELTEYDENIVLVAIIAGCGAAAAAGVIALFVGWYKLHNSSKAAADIEYPAYGVTGPNKEITPTGDRRLAQSAQMYHYQHQKQQIIAMESNRANNERRGSVSEGDSDEENEEGDYTVYECPGLAATGELEVKNPMFLDDPTPAATNQNIEGPPVVADKK